jgi:hypothetical protein
MKKQATILKWGGVMAGKKGKSGRKPETGTISDKVKEDILKAAEELAAEYGESIEKAMMRLCYIEGTQSSVKASIWKNYLEAMVVRETKNESTHKMEKGPIIGLPPIKGEDPALKVVKDE